MNKATLQKIFADPAEFRAAALPHAPNDWQAADFCALDPAWRRVAGMATGSTSPPAKMRAYLERPRGHSKTTDIASMVAWALMASQRQIHGICAAADRDQARLLRNAVDKMTFSNAWLREFLDVQSYRIRNPHTGSTLEIMSSDAGSSYGQTVDFICVDELTHWPTGGGELFWDAIFSTAAKVPDCLFLIISNAGVNAGSSWQWRIREACRLDPERWHFSSLDGPHASWITEDVLAEQERMLPPLAYRRLWRNEWTAGGDILDEADILAAIDRGLSPRAEPRTGVVYVHGLDGSVTRDHTALVTLGVDFHSRRIFLANLEHWIPPRGGQINLDDVEQTVLAIHKRYRGTFLYDPTQLQQLAQHCRRAGADMREVHFGSQATKIASALLTIFKDRQISIYPHSQLEADLRRVTIVQSANGMSYKLAATRRGSDGHCDTAVGLALAAMGAIDSMNGCGPTIVCDHAFWNPGSLSDALPAAHITDRHSHLYEPPPPGLSRFGGFTSPRQGF